MKALVSEELTPYASSILLDPEYGLPASKVRDDNAGLLLAYEKTGYDATTTSRLPDCLVEWSAKRLKEEGKLVKVEKKNEEEDAMESMNRSMRYMMPIMTVSIALIAPLGLALYWFVSNLLMILERLFVDKFVKEEE